MFMSFEICDIMRLRKTHDTQCTKINETCTHAQKRIVVEVIHTGGRERGDPPPLLNQHKYYNKVVLSINSSKVTNVLQQNGMHLFKDTYNFFQRCILAVKTLVIPHCFLVGGGCQIVSPPFRKILCEIPPFRKILYETL